MFKLHYSVFRSIALPGRAASFGSLESCKILHELQSALSEHQPTLQHRFDRLSNQTRRNLITKHKLSRLRASGGNECDKKSIAGTRGSERREEL